MWSFCFVLFLSLELGIKRFHSSVIIHTYWTELEVIIFFTFSYSVVKTLSPVVIESIVLIINFQFVLIYHACLILMRHTKPFISNIICSFSLEARYTFSFSWPLSQLQSLFVIDYLLTMCCFLVSFLSSCLTFTTLTVACLALFQILFHS